MRASGLQRGGGLNGQEVLFVDYEFKEETYLAQQGPNRGREFTTVVCILSLKPDAAKDPIKRYLKMGEASKYGGVSKDGKTLYIPSGKLSANSQVGTFLNSAVAAYPPLDEQLDPNPEVLNLEPLIGNRMRIAQPVNEEKTKKFGPEKGKDGKSFDRRDLIVDLWIGPQAASTNGARGRTSAAPAKAAPRAAAEPVDDVADELLTTILTESKTNSVPRLKINYEVAKRITKSHPLFNQREALRQLIQDEDWLLDAQDRLGIVYNKADKDQLISLAA